mmetsp:Transcript_10725/g.13389  ORF Transcript_10725/g.13389 Transcript_10725/m.13389 type:complete len:135 (-) Transcript_10725:641-1045(-)
MTFESWLQSNLFGPDRLCAHLPLLVTAAAAYGLFSAAKFTTRVLSFLWRHTMRRQLDLYAKYGSKTKKSWAVVTGGSDGYGLDMCHKLAAQGFNICIIARNEEKMKQRLSEIKANVEKKYVVADFFEMTRIEDF